MTIQIIEDEKLIRISRADYEREYHNWKRSQQYTTAPVSFELWLLKKGYGK